MCCGKALANALCYLSKYQSLFWFVLISGAFVRILCIAQTNAFVGSTFGPVAGATRGSPVGPVNIYVFDVSLSAS